MERHDELANFRGEDRVDARLVISASTGIIVANAGILLSSFESYGIILAGVQLV